MGGQINIPENGGAGCLLFAVVLPPRHRPEVEYTLIYVLNELNLGQTRSEQNYLVFQAMLHAWRCQEFEHISQSGADRIMAAANATNDEVLKIALLPQRFEGPVDFAESTLHMILAVFAQLGPALNEYSRPVMNLRPWQGNFRVCSYRR